MLDWLPLRSRHQPSNLFRHHLLLPPTGYSSPQSRKPVPRHFRPWGSPFRRRRRAGSTRPARSCTSTPTEHAHADTVPCVQPPRPGTARPGAGRAFSFSAVPLLSLALAFSLSDLFATKQDPFETLSNLLARWKGRPEVFRTLPCHCLPHTNLSHLFYKEIA